MKTNRSYPWEPYVIGWTIHERFADSRGTSPMETKHTLGLSGTEIVEAALLEFKITAIPGIRMRPALICVIAIVFVSSGCRCD